MVLGLIAGVAIVETALRLGVWTPPVQKVRGNGLRSVDGVPVWEPATDRYHRECVERHPERRRILFFGSSITFGTGLTAADTFTTALEARLNEIRPTPGFCVLNFAQAGFAFEQKYAVARIEVARYEPDLIMWENWVEWTDYRLIGDTAYGVRDLRIRKDGFVGVAGVPDGLNRVLFLHSRLYQDLALLFGERVETAPGPHGVTVFANERLSRIPGLAETVGATLVMYPAPPLDTPFSATAAALPDWHARLLEFTEARAIPTYPLQRELIDEDYLALRLDPCCHFNAAGHRALVPIMERIVLRHLAEPSADGKARGASAGVHCDAGAGAPCP